MSLASLYMTAPTKEQCLEIGRRLLEKRLVACINVFDGVSSMYWWEGKIEEAAEAIMIAKTQMRLVNACVAEIKEHHPYEVFCATALPILKANPEYIRWVVAETEQPEAEIPAMDAE